MNSQAKNLTNKLSTCAKNGETVDIFQKITLCALDIICETAMGKSIDAQSNSDSDYVKAIYGFSYYFILRQHRYFHVFRASEQIQHRQKSPWLWPDFIYNNISLGKQFAKYIETMHGFTRKVIKSKSKGKENKSAVNKRLAFLDLLLEVSDDGNVLSFSDIQEEVDTFMFEGILPQNCLLNTMIRIL